MRATVKMRDGVGVGYWVGIRVRVWVGGSVRIRVSVRVRQRVWVSVRVTLLWLGQSPGAGLDSLRYSLYTRRRKCSVRRSPCPSSIGNRVSRVVVINSVRVRVRVRVRDGVGVGYGLGYGLG